jgi:hypothetical protein
MAKRAIKEKEVVTHLQNEGFKEIKEVEKHAKWYKKASERPSCLKATLKTKIKSY